MISEKAKRQRGEGEGCHLISLGLKLDSIDVPWTHLDLLGLTWTHLTLLGLTLADLTSLGLTWAHMGLSRSHLDSLDVN